MSETPVIPGYRIERELGAGGMANVYLAVQEKLERKVAIKVLDPVLLRDINFARRFIKEAQTAAGLGHSGIVQIVDVGQSGNWYYLVMEYLEGGNLKERIHRGALDPVEALSIVRQVASALQYAHTKGYVHRDIKPDNIMFRGDGTAVITDFGIARAVDSTTKLTKTGMSIGTPQYMSPEQARGKTLDGRSDIYALGIVLYEMLTGHVPFDADDSVAIGIKHIQEPVPRLPGHLSRYQALLDGLLEKDPDRRVASGTKFCELVDALLGVKATPAGGIPLPRPTPKARQEARAPDFGYGPATKREGAARSGRLPSVLEMPESGREGAAPAAPSSGTTQQHLVPALLGLLCVLVVVLVVVYIQGQSGRPQPGAPGGAPSQVATSGGGVNTMPSDVERTRDDDAAKEREQDLQNQLAAQKAENERLQREQAAREQTAREEAAKQAQNETRRQAETERQRQAQEEAQRQAAQEEARRKAAEEAERQAAAARAASQRSSDGRFTDNGDGTVTDSRMGLMWAARDNGSNITWDDAKRYCENYSGGGYSDWRMPTISELQSLYDPSSPRMPPASCDSNPGTWRINTSPVIGVSCYWVWSSETVGSSDARGFTFRHGAAFSPARSDSRGGRALPVRSRR